MSGSNLVFIFTGSIAAYKACDAVSRLVQRGHLFRWRQFVPLLDRLGRRNRRAGAESKGHDLLRPDREAVARTAGQRLAPASREVGEPGAVPSRLQRDTELPR